MIRIGCRGDGLKAWRRLSKEYDASNPQDNLCVLKKIFEPTSCTVLRMGLESWEKAVSLYKEIVPGLCPPALQDYLDLHASRLNRYAATKSEVDAYLDTKTSASSPIRHSTNLNGKGCKAKGNGKKGTHQSQQPTKSVGIAKSSHVTQSY
eukprot:2260498-Amphidinium_carterae.2